MNRQSPSVTGLVPPRLFDLPTPNAGQATASTGTAPMNINEIILGYLPSEEAARELSDLYYRVSIEIIPEFCSYIRVLSHAVEYR